MGPNYPTGTFLFCSGHFEDLICNQLSSFVAVRKSWINLPTSVEMDGDGTGRAPLWLFTRARVAKPGARRLCRDIHIFVARKLRNQTRVATLGFLSINPCVIWINFSFCWELKRRQFCLWMVWAPFEISWKDKRKKQILDVLSGIYGSGVGRFWSECHKTERQTGSVSLMFPNGRFGKHFLTLSENFPDNNKCNIFTCIVCMLFVQNSSALVPWSDTTNNQSLHNTTEWP